MNDVPATDTTAATLARYRRLDRIRRAEGGWYDRVGLGPRRTPSRVVLERPGLRLLAFVQGGQRPGGPALLIVPAPIKRAYLWDLSPEVSVVRRALGAGLSVHMVEWLDPEGEALGHDLSTVADGLLAECREATAAEAGRAPWLAGHSLGGTLCALHAALHPERVAGLVLLEAPLTFGAQAGALAQLVSQAPPATVRALATEAVPGSLMSLSSAVAAPVEFVAERWLDRFASLGNPAALANHLRVERWTLDELAMPGPLYVDVVERLYREDGFSQGTLTLSGRPCLPSSLSMPLLAVADPDSVVVPPASAFGALDAVPPDRVRRLLHRDGPGVGLKHVGALVGREAHATLWPGILAWMSAPLP